MLLLAFTVTDPAGLDRDEKVHVLSRHFDTKKECRSFITSWEDAIKTHGVNTVQGMMAVGWKIRLEHVGCTEKPNLKDTEKPNLK